MCYLTPGKILKINYVISLNICKSLATCYWIQTLIQLILKFIHLLIPKVISVKRSVRILEIYKSCLKHNFAELKSAQYWQQTLNSTKANTS